MIHNNFDPSFDEIDKLLDHRFNITTGELDFTEPHKIISALNSYIDNCESESLKNEALDHIYFIVTKDQLELRKIEKSLTQLAVNDESKEWKEDVINYSKVTLLRKINSLIKWLNSNSEVTYELVKTNEQMSTSEIITNNAEKKHPLSEIWLAEAKITISEVVQKGIENGLWSKNLELISKKNSDYGSGKTLLASLAIALRGNAISSNSDYKFIGKVFCKTFNITIQENIGDPYKAFAVGKPHLIQNFKRLLRLK